MIEIEEGREELYDRSFMRYADEDTIGYKGKEIPTGFALMLLNRSQAKGIPLNRIYELAIQAYEVYPTMTAFSAKKLLKAEHSGKADRFLLEYPVTGNTRIKEGTGLDRTVEELTELFENDSRFNGRIPMILPEIALTIDFYAKYGVRRTPEEIVQKFRISTVRDLIMSGIPKMDAINIFCFFPNNQAEKLIGNNEICEMVSSLISKGVQKHDMALMNAAVWIAEHTDTNLSFLKKVYKRAGDINITSDMTVEAVQARLSVKSGRDEVSKVEKAYKECGFRLKDCECELRDNPIEIGRYRARILEATDPLQVMLGKLTDCCQKLGDAGESSMMYGLTNKHAGFWVLENKKTGKIYAQAEVWEYKDDTLVFDNIEFANDADIDKYREAIGAYVENSPYRNIIMGCGYNDLSDEAYDRFEEAPGVTPTVTPYDIYVMSYEEDAELEDDKDEDELLCISSVDKAKELLDNGTVTYYDYLYSDVDDGKGTVYLKKDDRIAEYFGSEPEKEDPDYDEEVR